MKKFKITKGNRVYIVDAKSHIDAISKVKAVKTDEVRDSISQWKPGMSEIGLFQISYKKGTVNQSILVKAATKEDAINKFTKHQPNAEVFGVNEYPNPHFGEPILDSNIKDGSIDYGTLTIDLNSPNELTSSKIVQELKNRIGNNKIAEIRGGSFISLREYGSESLELYFKEFRYNNWGTNSITLAVSYTVPAMDKALKNDPKYGGYKLRTELNNKLKQFANKTIYSNKSFTMDSAIKDMPLMFKSNVNMQSLKSNIDNVKNKPNETYINSLNANIQGIIADIEEIKGYEKEGKFNESPALKFSCKNLTAQYYKLLNDPKLQGTLHKLDVPTYKNVLYAEHQAQMLSQVTLKDSAIKDEDYSKYLSIVKQLEKLVEPANRALQQKIAKYGVTKQDIRNNSPKYRDVCREIPELKVWAKLIMQLPGELAGFMPAHPSQESVDKLKKAVTNSKAFDSTIK